MSCWLCVQTADHQLLAAVGEDPSVFVVMTLVFSSFSRLPFVDIAYSVGLTDRHPWQSLAA